MKNLTKYIVGIGLTILLTFSIAKAQTITQLPLWVSTTSPQSSITQQIYGKPLKITGLTSTLPLCLSANGLATTTGCSGSSSLSGGSTNALTYWINSTTIGATTSPTVGYITATSTTATSNFAGLLNVTGLTTLGNASTTQISSTGSAYFATSGGNVGIGTTAPGTSLHILTANGQIKLERTLTNEASFIFSNATVGSGGQIRGLDAGGLRFTNQDASTEWARITTAGNLGIGTTTPQGNLHVYGDNLSSIILDGNTGAIQQTWQRLGVTKGIIGIAGSTGGISAGTVLNDLVFRTPGNMVFTTDNGTTANVYIKTDGNVGIGTTGPGGLLDLTGSVSSPSTAPLLLLNNKLNPVSDGYMVRMFSDSDNNGAGINEEFYIKSNGDQYIHGNVGIGTTTPLSKLAVSGGVSVGADYNIAAPTNGMIIQGNVGIGTTTPSVVHKLTIDKIGDDASTGNVRLRSLANRYRADLSVNGASGFSMNSYDDTGTVYLPIQIDGSKTVLGMQGNVGIGTTTPVGTLHVDGGTTSTTTMTIGDLGSVNSKACFNTKNTSGANISFYFVGLSMIVENNLCTP